MMEEYDSPPPPLKGVVIISLPPPDDPSQGKTITAFTISPDAHRLRLPTSQPAPALTPPPGRSVAFSSKLLIGFLCTSAAVIFLLACVSSETPFEFLRASEEEEGRDPEVSSFLFPLYPKSGSQHRSLRGVEVKVGGAGIGGGGGVMELVGVKRRKVVKSSARATDSSALFPVRGNIFPDGLYYTIIHVGNPPRPYYLDVDTGSDITWIQCDAPCSSCAKGPNPLYKPSKGKIVPPSDSFCLEVQRNQNNGYSEPGQQCNYEIEYADRSSSMGVLARDELPLMMANSDMAKPTFVFGCAYDQQGQLLASPAKTDGILGLSGAKVGLASQLSSQNIITNVLGHCIAKKENIGGYMFLGDEFVPRWGMTWVPMITSPVKFYKADAQKISYGDQQLGPGDKGGNVGQIVFDTGSSYSYFTNAAYSDLITSLKETLDGLVQDESDLTLPICWQANFPIRSIEDVKQLFKPLTLDFGNSWLFMSRLLSIPPEGYLIISEEGNVCLGILNGTEVHDGSANILGDISLRGQLVVYDNVQQKIGWVASDCATPQRTTGFPFLF